MNMSHNGDSNKASAMKVIKSNPKLPLEMSNRVVISKKIVVGNTSNPLPKPRDDV